MTDMTYDANGSLHATDGRYAVQNRTEGSVALLDRALDEADLKTCTDNYLMALLFSSTGTGEDGEPDFLDSIEKEDGEGYTIYDFDAETRTKHENDIQRFASENAALIAEAFADGGFGHYEQLGHDFAMVRNGTGVGFQDRGIGEVGDKLYEAASAFPAFEVEVGDDGKIYA